MSGTETNPALRALARGTLVLFAAVGAAASAQPSSQIDVSGRNKPAGLTRSTAVAVDDLDLKSASGQRRLGIRLARASREVCSPDAVFGPDGRRDFQRCYTQALKGARAQAASRLASGGKVAIRVAAG